MITPKRHSQLVFESQKKYPEKHAARKKVAYWVRHGKIPSAKELSCIDCGLIANCYDHFLGYSKENQLNVEAVCWSCHLRRGKQRKEYKNGSKIGSGKKYLFLPSVKLVGNKEYQKSYRLLVGK